MDKSFYQDTLKFIASATNEQLVEKKGQVQQLIDSGAISGHVLADAQKIIDLIEQELLSRVI